MLSANRINEKYFRCRNKTSHNLSLNHASTKTEVINISVRMKLLKWLICTNSPKPSSRSHFECDLQITPRLLKRHNLCYFNSAISAGFAPPPLAANPCWGNEIRRVKSVPSNGYCFSNRKKFNFTVHSCLLGCCVHWLYVLSERCT